MQVIRSLRNMIDKRTLVVAGLGLLAGCAGANVQSHPDDYVEVANPGLTMSPNAPDTIWVPRSYVEKGVPRGNELAKKGYDAVTGGSAKQAAAAGATGSAEGTAPPAAPVPVKLNDTAGKPAALLPHFGLIMAQDANRIYFNLGREDGVKLGQKLTVYRGGTVVKGLGFAPGEAVGSIEVSGFVGNNGGFGVLKQGGQVKINDLVGFE